MVSNVRRLVIVGYGHLDAKLKAHATELGIASYVDFTGPLAPVDVAKRLNGALALVLLSTEEQFGQVVLEAQALSVPVIVSDAVGAVDCFVRNNTNGLIVDAYDLDGIARAMADLSENETLWKRMSEAAEPFSQQGDAVEFARSVDDLIRTLS